MGESWIISLILTAASTAYQMQQQKKMKKKQAAAAKARKGFECTTSGAVSYTHLTLPTTPYV